jgi:hypothetical protein
MMGSSRSEKTDGINKLKGLKILGFGFAWKEPNKPNDPRGTYAVVEFICSDKMKQRSSHIFTGRELEDLHYAVVSKSLPMSETSALNVKNAAERFPKFVTTQQPSRPLNSYYQPNSSSVPALKS